MQKVLVGIRSYLVAENLTDHVVQAKSIRQAFPKDFILYVSCGLKPSKELLSFVDKNVHYSDVPLGVGIPTKTIIDYSNENNYSKLVLLDGDLQHSPEQIAKIAANNEHKVDVALPQRTKRIVFSREKIDGKTIEDLECAFIRNKHVTKIADLAPGAYVFYTPSKLTNFNFFEKSWISDYLLIDYCFNKNFKISTPSVDVHSNIYTISNKRLVFREISQLEAHYSKKLQEIAANVRKDPYLYIHGGNIASIDEIIDDYRNYAYREKISSVKALILAGGKGTRLKPFTNTIQKQVFPLANKPILHYIMEKITQTGISEIGVIIGPNKDQIKNALGDGSKWNAHITYIEQDEPAGLAHAVICAKDFLKNDPFLMYLGDNIISTDLTGFMLDFVEGNMSSIMTVKVSDPSKFGIIEVDERGKIERLVEKPKVTKSNLGIVGIYAFTNKIFNAIAQIKPSARGELEITDAIQKLMHMGEPISYRVITDAWIDTGNIEAVLEANALILDGITSDVKSTPDEKSTIKGRVIIEENCKITNSVIIGPVSIGKNCVIENSFIGPYTTIGNDNKISESSVLYSLTLDNCKIENAGEVAFSAVGSKVKVNLNKKIHKEKIIAGEGENVTH